MLCLSSAPLLLKMDLYFLLEPSKSWTVSSIWMNWYNIIKIHASSEVKWCQSNFAHSEIILHSFSQGSWASWMDLLLLFSSCTVPVTLFPLSTWSTTACPSNLRQRHRMSVQRTPQKAGWFVVGFGGLFLNELSFWSLFLTACNLLNVLY